MRVLLQCLVCLLTVYVEWMLCNEYIRNEDSLEEEKGLDDSIAVIISGQCQRFIYREEDQPGTLFEFSRTNSSTTKIDVYIVLHCSDDPVAPFTGVADAPPYVESLDIEDVKNWYQQKGANKVEVKILDDQTMLDKETEITRQALNFHSRFEEEYDEQSERLNGLFFGFSERWKAETRKFYSKHLAYTMARSTQDYQGYVVMREDNFFLAPLDMDKVLPNDSKNEGQPYVGVDGYCEFGSYSDKIYVTNQLGADLLFSPTFPQFIEKMKTYMLFIFYKQGSQEPYQPEQFVHDSLSVAKVQRFNMKRLDVRFVKGTRCVPHMYFECMPEDTKEMAKQHGLVNCDSLKQKQVTTTILLDGSAAATEDT